MKLSYIIDIIVVALIWIISINGYKKGLIKTLYGFLAAICAIFITGLLKEPLCSFIMKTSIAEKISQNIDKTIADKMLVMPMWLEKTVSGNIADSLTQSVLKAVISAISVIIIYILVRLALRLFVGIADFIMRLPVLDIINRSGGLLFGLLKGMLITLLIFGALTVFVPYEKYKTVHDEISDTYIAKYFYNNNIIMKAVI